MFRKLAIALLLVFPLWGVAQNKIDLFILNQDYTKAIELINQKLKEKPSGELHFKKSIAHRQLMDYPAALTDLNAALQLEPNSIKYLTSRADLLQSMGNNIKAIADFQKALSLNPSDLLLKYELGKAYLVLNSYNKAYETFEEIQAVDSTNVMYNKYSAYAAYKANRNKRAIYLYEKYIPQNPDDVSAYINMANAYNEVNQEVLSLQYLTLARNRFPNNRTVHLKKANMAFVNKDYETAEKEFQSFMVKHDTLLPVFLNYGICLYHNKKTELALETLEAYYSVNPSDVYVNFYLGVCHKRLNHYELAAKYLDFAIYISVPEFHPEMFHHLAQVYGDQRKFEKSIECYKKAYELDSRKVEVLFEIATTYEEYNFNKTLALNYYQQYLKEAGEGAENAYYALDRIKRIKEDLFFEN